jgi:general secretion pathway protein B
MSFILDALKKSESDRQRQTGPALFEVKVAPPRSGFPVWAIAIVVLLVVNMGVVGWMLVRRMSHSDEGASTASAANTATQASVPSVTASQAPLPQVPAPMAQTSAPAQTSPLTPAPQSVPQQSLPQSNAPPAYSAQANQPASAFSANQPPAGYSAQSNQAANAYSPAQAPPAAAPAASEPTLEQPANPDDYAPATEGGGPSPFKGHVKRGTESGLPLYQDAALAQGSNLPQLRLDLHVYAARPQDRFALINMHKLHEGDTLPEGVHIESITPDGVVLSRNGTKFLLPRE